MAKSDHFYKRGKVGVMTLPTISISDKAIVDLKILAHCVGGNSTTLATLLHILKLVHELSSKVLLTKFLLLDV